MHSLRIISLLVLALSAVACASDYERRMLLANQRVAYLDAPSVPLAEFNKVVVMPSTYISEIAEQPKKIDAVKRLDGMIRGRLNKVLIQWPTQGTAGTLIIQPHVTSLRVVSGGARAWIGNWAGESHVYLDLVLKGQETDEVVAQSKVGQESGNDLPGQGAGKEENLLAYISDLIYVYLRKHGPAEAFPKDPKQ